MEISLEQFYARLAAIGLIIVLGFLLGKFKLINTGTNKQLVSLLLTVFMPASLFMAFPHAYNEELAQLFFYGLGGGVVVILLLILLSKVIFMKGLYKGELRFESQFALIFNNATFLGYPIVVSTFGEAGIIAYCGFIVTFNIALFSYGVYLFERKLTPKLFGRVLVDPNILAVAAGMVIYLSEVSLPSFLTDAVGYVGSATTPLSIICIGFMLSKAKFSKLIRRWRLMLTALIQLIVGPVVTYFALTFLRFPDEVVTVCTLIQMLPTATSLGLFATKYGGNEIESSELVAISTIFSAGTMPVLVMLLLN